MKFPDSDVEQATLAQILVLKERFMRTSVKAVLLSVVVATSATVAPAEIVQLRVTVENLAPANSISFAPFRFGLSNGTFDAFDEGSPAFLLGQPTIADAPIVSVAEGGMATTWFPAFAAAELNANLGSVLGPTGPILPGVSRSDVFTVDTANRFFTYASMVVPSNDHFIGNDDPQEEELFDAAGNLLITSFTEKASSIWDAGSETQDPANAAFLVDGVNAQRVDENLSVRFDLAGLSAFNGLTTAAGYTFDSSLLSLDSDIIRVSFSLVETPPAVPLPAAVPMAMATAGMIGLGSAARRALKKMRPDVQ